MKYANVTGSIPGKKSAQYLKQWKEYEADKTGYQAQVAIDHGKGAMLYDVDGNAFIDWTSGVLVTNVGHCHPKLVQAVHESSEKMLNVYEYCNPYRANAAKDLISIAPKHLDRCFFLSTGSEATDTAARIMKRASGKYEIISFFGGFHGRTLSTASLGGISKTKKHFGPMLPGQLRIPFPYCYRCPFKSCPEKCGMMCLEFADEIVRANSTGEIAGFIGEPYLGTAGFVIPPKGYWKKLEAWLRELDAIFTLDEVQSSYGRTGTMWAQEQEGITPDIVTVGKGIGSGVSVSALLMRQQIVDKAVGKGELGSTYGGNPVSCAAVSAVIEIMREEKLIEHSQKIIQIFEERLPKLYALSPYVGDVRGRGMIWGIELVEDRQTKEPAPQKVRQLIDLCANKGLLIGSVGIYGNVVRVGPPLVINEAQAHESLDIMEACIAQL